MHRSPLPVPSWTCSLTSISLIGPVARLVSTPALVWRGMTESKAVMFQDVPLFRSTGGAGGSAILESVFGECLGLIQASDRGATTYRDYLAVVNATRRNYLNVDP